ncbi:MAG: FAD-dependent oxidoreductase [Pseudomonadota bacterium]
MQELVLVGGGHAHVHVVKSFGFRRPEQGARVTLVGRDVRTPYSGMIPGFVAGQYSFEECHIDLARLCASSGVRLIHAEATGIDRVERRVLLKDAPPVSYDVLSLDVGSAPDLAPIEGADRWAIPVKPIAELGRRWMAFLERMQSWQGTLDVTVVGGGAGGVELALAMEHRLRAVARHADLQLALVTRGEIVEGHAASARRRLRRILHRRGVRLLENSPVRRIGPDSVHLDSGDRQRADAAFVVTEASAPAWFASTGLPTDERGFLAVDDCLRSTGDARIFAAGDCATMLQHRRPKAGVYAVRQGSPLARNLRLALSGRSPRPYTPQRRHLSIIGTGDGRAIASRGSWSLEGRWVWWWKDHIDRRWMRRYG